MASASLGVKRHCQSCGKNFYDLDKTPIVCPNCQTTFDPEVLLKSSRVKASVQPVAKAAETKAKAIEDDLDDDIEEDNDAIENDDDMLDDDSDIASITATDMNDDDDMEVGTGDDAIEDELDAPDEEIEE